MLDALWHIASHPSGGIVERGKCSGDRDDMIHTARQAIVAHYNCGTFSNAVRIKENQQK